MHTACCTVHSKNSAEHFKIIEKIAAISWILLDFAGFCWILQDFSVLLRQKKLVWQHTQLNNYIDRINICYLQNYNQKTIIKSEK